METTDDQSMDQVAQSLLMTPETADEPERDDDAPEDVVEEPQTDEADDQESEQDDAEGESEAAQEQPETFTVKVDGREVEVTLDELKRGYSGQSYIQKGMKEAAEAKRALDAEHQALKDAQAKFVDFVQQIQTNGIKPAPKPPSPELAQTDPIGYMVERAQYEADMQAHTAQQQQLQAMQAQRVQMTQAQMQAHLAEQQRILAEKIPDFADAQKAGEVKRKLVKAGQDYGYSAEELGGLTDARAVQVLHDAAKWREFQASKAKAQAPKAPPSVKPNAKRDAPAVVMAQKARQQMRRTGSVDDVAAFLLSGKE